MYKNRSIVVVVPAYNEELLITRVIDTMPAFVDRIVIVDDVSRDATCGRVLAARERDQRVELVRHAVNGGVGKAIVTGYQWMLKNGGDIAVVMAGDAQMDPADLPALLDKVIDGGVDYAKGNRLFTGEAWHMIPHVRYIGNATLSFLTKIASGYWHVADSQTGYTAATRAILARIPLDDLYPRYGFPNHILVHLNIAAAKVADVPVKPVYNIGEKSGIRLRKVIPRMSWLLLKSFFYRLGARYVIRDFHPLVLFYLFGFGLLLIDIPLIARLIYLFAETGQIYKINFLTVVFLAIMAAQFILFAMWFDMDYNKELKR
ncbi:MAG: glycosyltransferase family 2 protein [Planctomycetota bacterium]